MCVCVWGCGCGIDIDIDRDKYRDRGEREREREIRVNVETMHRRKRGHQPQSDDATITATANELPPRHATHTLATLHKTNTVWHTAARVCRVVNAPEVDAKVLERYPKNAIIVFVGRALLEPPQAPTHTLCPVVPIVVAPVSLPLGLTPRVPQLHADENWRSV